MGTLSDFKVAEGLIVGGSDIHLSGSGHATLSVDTVVGVDAGGKNLTISAGVGNGTGVGGTLDFKTAPAPGSGQGAGTATSRMNINGTDGTVTIGKVDINSGTIDSATIATSDITVGSGKTLDVSAGTLTLADNQISGDAIQGGVIDTTTISALIGDLAFGSDGSGVDVTFYSDTAGDKMLWDTSEEQLVITGTNGATALNVADGNVTVSDTLTATNIGAFQASGAIDFNTQAMTNVDINSGAIDGTPIGANSAQSGKFTSVLATTHGRINGADRANLTLLQVNGTLVAQGGNLGGGGNASRATKNYAEVRIHTDIAEADYANLLADTMGGVYIVDNEEPESDLGQGTIYTVGDGTETGASAWGVGRQATTGKFSIGYYSGKAYDAIADTSDNPMKTGRAYMEIDTSGNAVLKQAGATLGFTSNSQTTSFKGHNSASASVTYQLPAAGGSNGQVLKTDGSNVLDWVDQSSGSISALNNHSGNGNSLVTINGSTTTELDAEATATYNGQTLHINTATDNTPAQLLLEHSYNDTEGPSVKLRLDKGAAGAASDILGNIKWQGDDADQNLTNYASIKGDVVAATAGSEEGRLTVQLAQTSDGALADVMVLTGGDETDGTSSKVVIKGDLQVDGDTTTINTAQLTVEDALITVAKGNTNLAGAGGSGMEIEVTGGTNIGWKYVHGVTGWQSNVDIDLGSTSESYKIAGNDVLTDTQVLGKPVGTNASNSIVTLDDTQTLAAKTLETPKISTSGGSWAALMDTKETDFTGNSVTTIFSYNGASVRTAKLLIQVTNDSDPVEVHAVEMLVTYEGNNGPASSNNANVYAVEYASVYTGAAAMGTFDVADSSGSDNMVDVNFSPASSDTYKVKVFATLMQEE